MDRRPLRWMHRRLARMSELADEAAEHRDLGRKALGQMSLAAHVSFPRRMLESPCRDGAALVAASFLSPPWPSRASAQHRCAPCACLLALFLVERRACILSAPCMAPLLFHAVPPPSRVLNPPSLHRTSAPPLAPHVHRPSRRTRRPHGPSFPQPQAPYPRMRPTQINYVHLAAGARHRRRALVMISSCLRAGRASCQRLYAVSCRMDRLHSRRDNKPFSAQPRGCASSHTDLHHGPRVCRSRTGVFQRSEGSQGEAERGSDHRRRVRIR
jgi:hypothetical protein